MPTYNIVGNQLNFDMEIIMNMKEKVKILRNVM